MSVLLSFVPPLQYYTQGMISTDRYIRAGVVDAHIPTPSLACRSPHPCKTSKDNYYGIAVGAPNRGLREGTTEKHQQINPRAARDQCYVHGRAHGRSVDHQGATISAATKHYCCIVTIDLYCDDTFCLIPQG